MHFTSDRLERLQRSLELALNQEWPQLSATQVRLAKLRPQPIPARSASAKQMSVVATVATDGGENKLSLEPIQLQVIRVADSLGEVYFEDFVAQSLKPEEILRFFFQSMDCKGIPENRQGGPINFAPPRERIFRPLTPEFIHSFMGGSKILSGYQSGVDWLFCPARYRKPALLPPPPPIGFPGTRFAELASLPLPIHESGLPKPAKIGCGHPDAALSISRHAW